ncbi:MAG: hypothetical protein AAFU64_05530, partial [Bacteroidota bacterium]
IYWIFTFAIVYLYSLYNLYKEVPEKEAIQVQLVHLSLPPSDSDQPGPVALSNLLKQNIEARPQEPDLIVLPDLGRALNPCTYQGAQITDLEATLKALNPDLPSASILCGVSLRDPNIAEQEPLSTALQLKAGQIQAKRQRHRRVPGSEMPFLSLPQNWTKNLFPPGFYLGNSDTPSATLPFFIPSAEDSLAILPLLSYEMLFGNVPSAFPQKQVGLLVYMVDNSWWGNRLSQKQLIALAKIRAIESRKPLIINANPSISAYINRNGQVQKTFSKTSTGTSNLTLRPNTKITFYTQFGDYLGRLSWFLAIALFLSGLVRKKTQK